MSQFYALMSDNTVKHISLKEEIVTEIKNIFINGGAIFKPEGIEEDVFDGNIISRNGENITYVHYDLPEDFARIPYNQADMSEYNINEDMPKSIFYYDDGKFYFQVFNKRNMLQRKMVLQFECGNIFAKMNNSAFIVEDKIHALYEEGKLYFQSYTVANQIFSLIDFVTEATNAEIESIIEIGLRFAAAFIQVCSQHIEQHIPAPTIFQSLADIEQSLVGLVRAFVDYIAMMPPRYRE